MRTIQRVALLATALVIATALRAAPIDRDNGTKKVWEWTDEERITARTDPARIAERIHLAKHPRNPLMQPLPENSRTVDVINGHDNPEVFLPTEIFEGVVEFGMMDGYVHEVDRLVAAGLPPNFWQKLEPAIKVYVLDLQTWKSAPPPVVGDNRSLVPTLCRDRAEALAKAREMFGSALDRFMYGYIVRGMTISTTSELEPADVLRSRENGCR